MKCYIVYFIQFAILMNIFCSGESLSAETVGDIKPPRGYSRILYDDAAYSSWLKRLPVKKDNKITRHDGNRVPDSCFDVLKVIDMPLLFSENIEQCADWGFRFWAEYHKDRGILDRLYLLDYNGNKKFFRDSGRTFYSFLKYSMNYANSYSIKSGCEEIPAADIMAGDMIVQNRTGGIGHVSIVLDMCINADNEKLYLIGYSFMPAQQFHIERAYGRYGKEGWFSLEGYEKYLEDKMDYGKPVLRRFR